MERLRLRLPPHDSRALERGMRLACQCIVQPGAELTVRKNGGFWGQKVDEEEGCDGDTAASGVYCKFDLEVSLVGDH